MRKALVIGIDQYNHIKSLNGCVNDASAIKDILERHADGSINFAQPRLMMGTSKKEVSKNLIKEAARELFKDDSDIALFYFAGHGYIEDTGGFLCGSDCKNGDDGFSLSELMHFATTSPAKNKVIILDSCHGGITGDKSTMSKGNAEVGSGVTILTASTSDQYAMETMKGGRVGGVFTNLLLDALSGAAASLVGDITPGSVYAHIDQSLGAWSQRPVFKTNVKTFVSLRKAAPPIPLEELRMLDNLFPAPGFDFKLDPSYEPERNAEQLQDPSIPKPDASKTPIFSILQNYVRVNLARPVGTTHMWHAAMQSKSCCLTVLGEHYRTLAAEKLI